MGRKKGIEQDIDRLFSLDPSEFIAARDEQANNLKAEGRAEEGAEVRGLRRPTVAAWAVNQVARQRPDEVKELLAAGVALRQAQRKVLSGVKGGGFREATDRRRRAVAALVKSAEAVLQQAGKGSAGTLEAVQSTFEAASIDQEAGDQLKRGRLTRELSAASGFGGVTGLDVVAAPRERPRAREKDEPSQSADLEASRREVKELEKAATEARRRAIRARADADRAEARAEELTRKAEEARAQAKQAGSGARKAEAEADRAQAAADRAAGKLQALR